jgi:hypothetical protein
LKFLFLFFTETLLLPGVSFLPAALHLLPVFLLPEALLLSAALLVLAAFELPDSFFLLATLFLHELVGYVEIIMGVLWVFLSY